MVHHNDDDKNVNDDDQRHTKCATTIKLAAPQLPELPAVSLRRSDRIKNRSQISRQFAELNSFPDADAAAAAVVESTKENLKQIEIINREYLKTNGIDNFEWIHKNIYKCKFMLDRAILDMPGCDCYANSNFGCIGNCINRVMFIECDTRCQYGASCTNKRMQNMLNALCHIRRTEKKGYGLFASEPLKPYDFIMEFVGEVINENEYKRRLKLYANMPHYAMTLGQSMDVIIDATKQGNLLRYLNHSCAPNALIEKWTVNGVSRMGCFSRKSIGIGEEITIKYNNRNYGDSPEQCFCDEVNCCGWIGTKPAAVGH